MENSNASSSVKGSRVARKNLRLSELSCENDSKNCPEHFQVSVSPVPECQKTEPNIPKWTNEKHSSYLKSLETSFVSQVYDSKDNLGRRSRRECTSGYTTAEQKHSDIATPSGQHYRLQCNKGSTVNDHTIIEGNAEATDQNFIEGAYEEEK